MKYKAAAVLTPAVIFLTPAIQAQQYTNPSPFSIRAGASYLTDSKARNALQNFGLLLGVGYDLPFRGVLSAKTGQASIDFDYQGFRGHGNRFDSYALQYVERVPFSAPSKNSNEPQGYWGLGVGVYQDRGDGSGGSGGGSQIAAHQVPGDGGGTSSGVGSSSGSANRTAIGGEVILGVTFQQKFFIESAFHFRGSFNGVSPNTISLAVGLKF